MANGAELPRGFFARPPATTDLDEVLRLVRARELADGGDALLTREDLEADWGRPGFDLAQDAILVVEGERIIGEAETFRGRAEGHVHPDFRGRRIGAWLLQWLERRARAAGDATTRQTVADRATAAAELLRGHGYDIGHTSWILEIAFDERPPEPAPPPGVELRPFVPGQDDRAVHRVIEDAFNEWTGRAPSSFEYWAAVTTARRGFDPALVHVAAEGERIVGACVGIDYPGEGGWVGQLAVAASHRHRGIARALLQRAFLTAWERGERTCGLSTDSRTGALALYERVGMRVKSSYTNYVKALDPASSGSAARTPRTA